MTAPCPLPAAKLNERAVSEFQQKRDTGGTTMMLLLLRSYAGLSAARVLDVDEAGSDLKNDEEWQLYDTDVTS